MNRNMFSERGSADFPGDLGRGEGDFDLGIVSVIGRSKKDMLGLLWQQLVDRKANGNCRKEEW